MKKTTLKTWLFTRPLQFALRMLVLLAIAWAPRLFPAIEKIPLPDVVLISIYVCAMVGVFVCGTYKLITTLKKQNIPQNDFIVVIKKYNLVIFVAIIVLILTSGFEKNISSHFQNQIIIILYKTIGFSIATYLLGVGISEFYLRKKYNKKLKKKDAK